MFERSNHTYLRQDHNGNGFSDHARVTIRELADNDSASLRELAERDTRREPQGEVVGAERGGRLMAAISLTNGDVVADPFHPTADLVTLLRVRAGQILPPPV
jgi:hypothetical protein